LPSTGPLTTILQATTNSHLSARSVIFSTPRGPHVGSFRTDCIPTEEKLGPISISMIPQVLIVLVISFRCLDEFVFSMLSFYFLMVLCFYVIVLSNRIIALCIVPSNRYLSFCY